VRPSIADRRGIAMRVTGRAVQVRGDYGYVNDIPRAHDA
jgi:hypothetical protein